MEGKKKKREKERNPVSSSGRRVWRRNSPGEAGSFGGGGERGVQQPRQVMGSVTPRRSWPAILHRVP